LDAALTAVGAYQEEGHCAFTVPGLDDQQVSPKPSHGPKALRRLPDSVPVGLANGSYSLLDQSLAYCQQFVGPSDRRPDQTSQTPIV
jgi:hypothetical protein